MLRVAICDDDPVMLEKLSLMVSNKFDSYNIGFKLHLFSDGKDLIKEYQEKHFDVLFLDIQLPEFNGFDVAKLVRKQSRKTYIIFVTTEDGLVYDAFDFNSFYFIPKFSDAFIEKKLEHVIKNLVSELKQHTTITLELPFSDKKVISLNSIVYIKSEKNEIKYFLDNAEHILIRGKLSEAEENLADYGFVRIHNRFLVNLFHIKQIDYPNFEIKTTAETLKMSRSYKSDLEKTYNDYLNSQI
jgi:DNA-binding LytR/AlgR family response regulator